MNRFSRTVCLCATISPLFASGFAMAAPVTVTQFVSASQLSAGDTTFQNPDPIGTVYPGPSVSFTTAGGKLTFSRSSGAYEADQAGFNYGDTAFSNGTKLLGAGGFQGAGSGGPITLTFGTAVSEFGLNIEDFSSSTYTVLFSAFDPSGTSLGTFSSSGIDPVNGGSGTLSFEGLSVSGDSIAKVVFDDSAAGGSNDLLFGNVKFGSPQTAPAVTPEPSSFLLLGTGLLGMAGAVRRKIAHRT